MATLTTQKIQGIAKRNNINLVDETRSHHALIAYGIYVRKARSSQEILVTIYGNLNCETINSIKEKFFLAITKENLVAQNTLGSHSTYTIKAVA